MERLLDTHCSPQEDNITDNKAYTNRQKKSTGDRLTRKEKQELIKTDNRQAGRTRHIDIAKDNRH